MPDRLFQPGDQVRLKPGMRGAPPQFVPDAVYIIGGVFYHRHNMDGGVVQSSMGNEDAWHAEQFELVGGPW